MEKKVNKFLAASLILAAVFAGLAFLFRNSPHASEAGGEYAFPLLEYLDIELQRLDVSLIPYDGEEITVEYKNDRPLVFETGDNKLSITENSDFVVSLFPGKETEFGVKIYLPEAAYRDINVYTSSGGINIGDIDCRKLSAVTESGDMNIKSMSCLAALVSTSGVINADIETVVQETDILNRSGDINLTIPPESSVAIDFRTKDGECETSLVNRKIHGDYLYSFNGGKKQISVTAEHGTFVFEERNRK